MKMDNELRTLIEKHMASFSEWKEGQPVKVFKKDGYPCVQYESGSWWHYNIARGTWF